MTDCLDRPAGPVEWVLRVDGPLPGHDNMAADEETLESLRDPAALPVLRLFRWKAPTLTYGRLQDGHTAANQAMILGARAAVRRPTGGGTVVHREDVSFSLAWRRDHPSLPACLKNVYRGIHDAARSALAALGVRTDFYHRDGGAPGHGLCYDEPAQDDLMWNGKKVVGGAIRVTGWGRLYQGNIQGLDAALLEKCPAALVEAFTNRFFQAPAR